MSRVYQGEFRTGINNNAVTGSGVTDYSHYYYTRNGLGKVTQEEKRGQIYSGYTNGDGYMGGRVVSYAYNDRGELLTSQARYLEPSRSVYFQTLSSIIRKPAELTQRQLGKSESRTLEPWRGIPQGGLRDWANALAVKANAAGVCLRLKWSAFGSLSNAAIMFPSCREV